MGRVLKTFRDLWERHTHATPDAPAVTMDGVTRSYHDVTATARRLASSLAARGVVPQDRVSLLSRNRMEWFDYYAACELHGFIAATLNFRLATAEFAYIVNDCSPAVIIFEDAFTAIVDQFRPLLTCQPRFVCIGEAPSWAEAWSDLLGEGDPAGPDFVPEPRDGVRLIYTSGTTGKPKGVLRSQSADLALARICATTSDMGEFARELIMMPMFHVGGQSMASGALWVGGCVVLHRDFDPDAILRSIEADRIDILHVTPTIMQAIVEHPNLGSFDLSSLRTVVYAGAAMPVPLLRKCLDRIGPVFLNCYGSTESGASIILRKAFHRLDGSAQDIERLGSLGHAHADSSVRILDDDGADCPLGTIGEIAVQGPAMMTGYWNNPEATARALQGDWLRTGDIGRIDDRGFVHLVDRKADMVISGGENIYSREVEEALLSHPAVRSAAVIGVTDSYWGEAVVGIVVLNDGGSVDAQALIAHCTDVIARYKAPKRIEFVTELPLLPSAKVDKPTLRRRYGNQENANEESPS